MSIWIGPQIVATFRFWSRIVASVRVCPELSRFSFLVPVRLNCKRTDPWWAAFLLKSCILFKQPQIFLFKPSPSAILEYPKIRAILLFLRCINHFQKKDSSIHKSGSSDLKFEVLRHQVDRWILGDIRRSTRSTGARANFVLRRLCQTQASITHCFWFLVQQRYVHTLLFYEILINRKVKSPVTLRNQLQGFTSLFSYYKKGTIFLNFFNNLNVDLISF